VVPPVDLVTALRISPATRLAVVGAGGKTTLLFRLAKEMKSPVIVSTSTHLSLDQAGLADHHHIIRSTQQIQEIFQQELGGVNLFTGEIIEQNRLASLPPGGLDQLAQAAGRASLPLLIEADGARNYPMKAPAEHEPAIPAWANHVVVVAGLSGLGKTIQSFSIHRPERFAELAEVKMGDLVTPEALTRVLLAPQGGLKNIPPGARRTVLFNQADDDSRQAAAGHMAESLLAGYDDVLVTALQDPLVPVKAVFAPVAGIILAAGKSSRMGKISKVLLDWQGEPFVRRVARTALKAGLKPVVVVTGSDQEPVAQALAGLDVVIAHNDQWETGQSSSLQKGLRSLPESTAAAIFLLADMPQVTGRLLSALVEEYRWTLGPIIAPMVEDRRANPVLFDRVTFGRILELQGDVGGRAIFSHYRVDWLPWQDALLLLDVDTLEDYRRLHEAYESRNASQPE
jgi:molybdenum cofactor cytidylyltransferase